MAHSRKLPVLVLTCMLAIAVLPGAALGVPKVPAKSAPAASASSTAPVAEGPIDGQIWPGEEGPQTAALVDITLDPKVRLPARVRIPVPSGAVVQWAGEILGGDPNADPERAFTLHSGSGGGKYAEFTLSVSHRGQIETNGIPLTANGTVLSTQVEFVQSVPATSVTFSVRIPAGVTQVKIDPSPSGPPSINTSTGDSLYLLALVSLATGAKTTVKITFNTSPTGATQTSAPSLTAVYIVLGVLLVALIAIVVYLFARERASSATGGDEDEQAGDADEPGDDEGEEDHGEHRTEDDDMASGASVDHSEADEDPFDLDETDWFGKD